MRRTRTGPAWISVFAVVVVIALLGVLALQLPGHDRPAGALPPATPSRSALSATPQVYARPTLAATSPAGSVAPPSGSPSPVGPVDAALVAARTRAVKTVLAAHATALLHRDRAGWAATLDPSNAGYRKAQLAVFANTAAVPFASYFYDVDDSDVAGASVPRAGQLLVAVTLRYALRGFDPEPTALRQYLTFVTADSGWRLAGDTDGAAQGLVGARDLWDFGPVVAVRGRRSLVLAHPGATALAHTLTASADAAVPRVTAFWGDAWARRVVILVPGSQDELRQIVGTKQDLSQIAALATAEIGAGPGSSSAVGDRIAINPTTFGSLGALGRRVVMTHEITHVASRAVTGAGSPTWLVEGLADYVGFKGTSTSLRFDAAELARQVDAGHPPTALPSSSDFAHAGPTLSLDYEQAWMACKFIVSRTSEATLIKFYKQVGTAKGAPAVALKAAFAQVLHTDQATFTRSWASYVKASLR
ncbi:MAG: hypothetical protein QOJ11_2087 [Frankiales bacterium]|nr:hypothetical protein [Frankiales bacterium]